jgi:hypothetical protein
MNRGELEALGVMIGVVLGWSDSVRATVANHWSRTPSPTTTYQVAAAGGVHCAGSRKRCQTVDKAVRRRALPETVGCVDARRWIRAAGKQPEAADQTYVEEKHGDRPVRTAGRIGHGGLRTSAHSDLSRSIQGERV